MEGMAILMPKIHRPLYKESIKLPLKKSCLDKDCCLGPLASRWAM